MSPDPILALRGIAAALGVEVAALRTTLAELEAMQAQFRQALALAEAEAKPRVSSDAEWRQFCDRVYAEMVAMRLAPEAPEPGP